MTPSVFRYTTVCHWARCHRGETSVNWPSISVIDWMNSRFFVVFFSCVAVICDSDEDRHHPAVFATATLTFRLNTVETPDTHLTPAAGLICLVWHRTSCDVSIRRVLSAMSMLKPHVVAPQHTLKTHAHASTCREICISYRLLWKACQWLVRADAGKRFLMAGVQHRPVRTTTHSTSPKISRMKLISPQKTQSFAH